MRGFTVSSVVLLLAGCSSARPPPSSPAIAATAPTAAEPAPDLVPLSVRRLVSEQRDELRDVLELTTPLSDPHGRARATREATTLASELREIEAALDTAAPSSAHFDEVVERLQRLSTRVALLHEALFGAVSKTTALEADPGH